MTPRQFHALSKRYRDQQEAEVYSVSRVVAAIYDVNRDPKKRKKPITAEDFIRVKPKTPVDLLAQVKILHKAFGGE